MIGVITPPMHRGICQIVLIASFAAQASAQPPEQAATPAKWLIHVGDDRCLATHKYQVSGKDWVVALEPRPMTDKTSLMLLAPVGESDLRQAHLRTADVPIAASGLSLEVNDPSGHRLYSVILTHAEMARLSSTGSLRMEDQQRTTNFALTEVPQVQQHLDSCVHDLLASWGLSADRQAALGSFPATDREPAAYVRPEDLNAVRLRPGMNATATVLVQVEVSGQAHECTVIHSTGDTLLDARTCKIFVDRARYHPAVDRSGNLIKAPLVASITWAKP
jgi:hypothetical protein